MNTYAPDPITGQIVASQPQATQPSFNIPFLGKKTYDPNKGGGNFLEQLLGGHSKSQEPGAPNNNIVGNLINTLVNGGFKTNLQGGFLDRAVSPIAGGLRQSGQNMGHDVSSWLINLLQNFQQPQPPSVPVPPSHNVQQQQQYV